MKTLDTEATIAASAQTIWSILDDLERYPEWNALVPELHGKTTLGEVVEGRLVQPNTPVIPLAPTITRVVGARELRWVTVVPGDDGFTAEHYFKLSVLSNGKTHLVHSEDFDGPAITFMWGGIDVNGRQAYNQMNADLKTRAEAFENADVVTHPAVDRGSFADTCAERSTLTCLCSTEPVMVDLSAPVAHNHLCGCSKCWKPEGALFAQTAVVPAGTATVTESADKLVVVDDSAAIKRYACSGCGVHMYGRVDDKDHHFYGLDFVHPERGDVAAPRPEFAGFVSSVIEAGASPSSMHAIRTKLIRAGVPPYDGFSPELSDLIAWHKVKIATAKRRTG